MRARPRHHPGRGRDLACAPDWVTLERALTDTGPQSGRTEEIVETLIWAMFVQSVVVIAMLVAVLGPGRPRYPLHARRTGDTVRRNGAALEVACTVVAAGGALLVDNADLDPAWIEATLIPVLADSGRIAAMSARASAAARRAEEAAWQSR